MIYNITPKSDRFYEKIFKESMIDLNKFYEINWVHHTPRIIVVKDRKTIDLLKGVKTEPWVVGWSDGRTIYILNKNHLEKESNHKYNPATYYALLKHEISHAFYHIVSMGQYRPAWLCEGVAIYTSGQIHHKKQPIKFKNFLKFTDKGGSGVYAEPGFVIEMLVRKFGKEKLLKLIEETKMVKLNSQFNKLFKRLYGFKPTYKEFNGLYKK